MVDKNSWFSPSSLRRMLLLHEGGGLTSRQGASTQSVPSQLREDVLNVGLAVDLKLGIVLKQGDVDTGD